MNEKKLLIIQKVDPVWSRVSINYFGSINDRLMGSKKKSSRIQMVMHMGALIRSVSNRILSSETAASKSIFRAHAIQKW